MVPQIISPQIAGKALRLNLIDKMLGDDADATGKVIGMPHAGVIIAMIAALANRAADWDRKAAADFFHAIWQALANPPASAELDRRRVDATAVALFQQGWRYAKKDAP